MKKLVLGVAALIAGAASQAQAATVFSENFDGSSSAFTSTGNVVITNGAGYAACCGTTGQTTNQFAAFGSGNTGSGTLSATFATQVGGLYTISFLLGALSATSELNDPLKLRLNIGPVFSYDTSASPNLAFAFSPAGLSFTATSASTTITFTSLGADGDNVDAILDDVTVTGPPVPEPATWGMMILGLGAVGGMLRRRRANIAYA